MSRLAVPRAAVAGVLATACALFGGCGTGGAEGEASRAVERLHAAVEARDGQAACSELTEEATDTLEQQEEAPCENAVLELELSEGEAATAEVYIRSAMVTLAQGGADFLDETSEGWRVSAAGCEPRPGLPWECELED
jgi:hypothetical protein